jgi:ribonuclease PH
MVTDRKTFFLGDMSKLYVICWCYSFFRSPFSDFAPVLLCPLLPMIPRKNNRSAATLRPIRFDRDIPGAAPGRGLVSAGSTVILCTASIDPQVPPWMAGRGKGWLTAEYNMLPGSTSPRKRRDRSGKVDGRTTEIQRLIGRSLRAVVDLEKLGEQTITIDCDVLEADGGTRTLSITGGFIALVDALNNHHNQGNQEQASSDPAQDLVGSSPITDSIAAVSVGMVQGQALLDLDYSEDVQADVDMNVVMTGQGRYVELQGTGEEATFTQIELDALLSLARQGIDDLKGHQRQALGTCWPG